MADNSLAVRDPYVWHNDTVLKNRLDIHDEAQLRKAELAFSAARLATLELGPRSTGMPWLCHIHRTLFQDLYSWAGSCAASISGVMRRLIAIVNTSRKRAMR